MANCRRQWAQNMHPRPLTSPHLSTATFAVYCVLPPLIDSASSCQAIAATNYIMVQQGTTHSIIRCGLFRAIWFTRILFLLAATPASMATPASHCSNFAKLNDSGDLPLHLACAELSISLIKYLYDLHPEAILETDSLGKLPIEIVCECSDEDDEATSVEDIIVFRISGYTVHNKTMQEQQVMLNC